VNAVFYVSYVALWVLVGFQTLVILGLVKAVSQRTAAVSEPVEEPDGEGLEGQMLPEFEATDVSGTTVTSSDLVGREGAILFVSPDCSTCVTTLREVAALRARAGGNLVIVCKSRTERCQSLASFYDLDVPVIPDEDRSLTDLFHIVAPPTAVRFDADGRVDRYGHPMTTDDVAEMIGDKPPPNGDAELLELHHHQPAGAER
jgi:peroxiredoxin